MISRLLLRHEILHTLTKPLLITVTTVTLVLNILAFQMVKEHAQVLVEGPRAVLAQYAFLIPFIMILWMGKADNRCWPWEAGFPLEARALWWSHLGALALANLFLIGTAAITFVGFGSLISILVDKSVFHFQILVDIVVRPVGVTLAATILVAVWRPNLGRLTDAEGWSRYRALVVLGSVGLLGILTFLPPWYAAVPLVIVGTGALRLAAGLPPSLEMGRTSAGSRDEAFGDSPIWSRVEPSPRVVRLVVLRTLSKWPISWLALIPFSILFGLMMSGANILGMDEPYLRFTNFFLSVYILFAMSNHFMENLYKVDHLPIGRRNLLRWLVVPVALAFGLGYGAGSVIDLAVSERPEALVFENGRDNYGLKIPPEAFAFTTSLAPRTVTAPWGESHTVQPVRVFRGIPGALWKPFATPEGASGDFVAWQISRAADQILGLELLPGEVAARYLTSDLEGRVTVRDSGLTLVADFPEAEVQSSGPIFPLLVGGVFITLMIVMKLYFMAFRPGITIRKSRVIFWALMGGLMALHIGGYVVFILEWTRDWLVYGFWLGRFRELGELGWAGYAAAWLGMSLLLVLAWRWAEKSFLAVEAPSS